MDSLELGIIIGILISVIITLLIVSISKDKEEYFFFTIKEKENENHQWNLVIKAKNALEAWWEAESEKNLIGNQEGKELWIYDVRKI